MSDSKIERATMLKSKMAEHRLTSQWMLLRLSQDHDIEIDKTTLSMILSGTRRGGEQPGKVISAAEQIIAEYESHYKKEGA